jgi:hypothetical protein
MPVRTGAALPTYLHTVDNQASSDDVDVAA